MQRSHATEFALIGLPLCCHASAAFSSRAESDNAAYSHCNEAKLTTFCRKHTENNY